jgi:hypothetical protein
MRLYNVEQHAQEDILDDKPAFDNTKTGEVIKFDRKFEKDVFADFK